jgi:hypothetical protein
MFKVRCGVKLNHWDEGQVVGSKKVFSNLDDAKTEVGYLLNTVIKKMFEKVSNQELYEIDKNHIAQYVNDDIDCFLKARMDGEILDENNEGEFYIEIIEK